MPRRVKQPIDELQQLAARSTRPFAEQLLRVARASFRGDERGRRSALRGLQKLAADTMALADLLGRRRLFLEADAADRGDSTTESPRVLFDEASPLIAAFPGAEGFLEAIEDLARREPRLADPTAGVPLWRQVADLYQEGPSFAVARAADLVLQGKGAEALRLTGEAQATIARGLARGAPKEQATAALARLEGFTEAYAETVFRTNLNTAYTAGRFRQAQDDAVVRVIGAFEFFTTGDTDVRRNHDAADGLIASQFDPVWERFAPPLGYNCRCSVGLVDRFRLERMGLVDGGRVLRREPARFREAHPDEGFEKFRRPDRAIYG